MITICFYSKHPRYQLDCFTANLKQKIVRLLNSEGKNHRCLETDQGDQVSRVPPNKPKT